MKRFYSLKGRNLFKEVYKKGKKIQGNGVKIFILKIDVFNEMFTDKYIPTDAKKVKIGISIQKKIGNAVFRNKIKRRIRSIFGGLLSEMNDGFCIIITPEVDFKSFSFEKSKSAITSLLIKTGVLNKNELRCNNH